MKCDPRREEREDVLAAFSPEAIDKKTTKQIFGANLRRIILEKGMSLNAFADKHNINRRMLGFWTAGDHFVTAEKIDQLCDWLEIKPEDLFREPGN